MSEKLRDSRWDRNGVVARMLGDVQVPRMAPVRQALDHERIDDIPAVVKTELMRPEIRKQIEPGASIAITVGSRGVANISEITREIVRNVRSFGAEPFVIPAMGSHGGGTAEGQMELLASLGVTEDVIEAPVRSSMEVVQITALDDGRPVFIDKLASESDGIIVVGRVKPHTAYRGTYESGLFKMLAIGLGKHRGAEACHDQGFSRMAENVPAFAKAILKNAQVLFGLAVIENAHDETCKITAIEKDKIEDEEPALLDEARARMAQIYIRDIDVLVVDEIGKNHSGDGMDPNVTGSFSTRYASGGPDVHHYVVLDISEESHGNAVGLGRADYTTKRVFDKADFDVTYPNALTAKVALVAKTPMVLSNDRLAIQAAIKTCESIGPQGPRVVRIRNSAHVDEIFVSESLIPEVEKNPNLTLLGQPNSLQFDGEGNLF